MLILVPTLLVLLSIAAVVLWWFSREKPPEPPPAKQAIVNPEEPEQHNPKCDEAGSKTYQNEGLGFGLCYPKNWGDPRLNNATFQASDTGSRWRLTFSRKVMISVGVVSKDWTSKAPRDLICTDASKPTAPPFLPFVTTWQANDTSPPTYAIRGIEMVPGKYLIQEYTDSLLVHGACLEGYILLGKKEPYDHVTISYGAEWDLTFKTVTRHLEDPNHLIPESEREQFRTLVQSVFEYSPSR